jgi:hypothetical protein
MNFNSPIAFIDSPEILNCSVTPIPANSGSFLQVIADTGARSAGGIEYIDTTGDFIGVYLGASGFEVLLCIIGNGLAHKVTAFIPPNSRISLRSMTANAITNGELTMSIMSH